MGMLDQLTPTQRTALLAGVPVVGAVVLYQSVRGRSAPDPATPPTADFVTPPTDAIGTGEIGDIFTTITGVLGDLTTRITDLENRPTTTPSGTGYPRALKTGTVGPGDTASTIASRLRAGGQKTYKGQPLTAAYLMSVNSTNGSWDHRSTTTRQWSGAHFRY